MTLHEGECKTVEWCQVKPKESAYPWLSHSQLCCETTTTSLCVLSSSRRRRKVMLLCAPNSYQRCHVDRFTHISTISHERGTFDVPNVVDSPTQGKGKSNGIWIHSIEGCEVSTDSDVSGVPKCQNLVKEAKNYMYNTKQHHVSWSQIRCIPEDQEGG